MYDFSRRDKNILLIKATVKINRVTLLNVDNHVMILFRLRAISPEERKIFCS
jgi:hypothetical protein